VSYSGIARAAQDTGEPQKLKLFYDFGHNLTYVISFTIAWIIEVEIWQYFTPPVTAKQARTPVQLSQL
jgi:hypothetical protein